MFLSFDWYKQKDQSENLVAVIVNLVRLLGIKLTITHIRDIVKAHPDFPSLLSVAETLEWFGIETEALQGTVNDLELEHCPSIIHMKGDRFAVLEEIDNGYVTYIDPDQGRNHLNLSEFSQIWNGVLLTANPGPEAGDKDYSAHRKKEIISTLRKYLVLPGLALLLTFLFVSRFQGVEEIISQWNVLLLWSIKWFGFAICLAMVNLHGESFALKRLCSLGEKVNCLKVLNSPAGKLFGFSMADIGVVYFLGGILTFVYMSFTQTWSVIMPMMAILSMLTIPYTVFSLAYQGSVIKVWCLLCLSVQILFWIEFGILHGLIFKWNSPSLPIISFLALHGTAVLVWFGLHSVFTRARRTSYLEHQLRHIAWTKHKLSIPGQAKK